MLLFLHPATGVPVLQLFYHVFIVHCVKVKCGDVVVLEIFEYSRRSRLQDSQKTQLVNTSSAVSKHSQEYAYWMRTVRFSLDHRVDDFLPIVTEISGPSNHLVPVPLHDGFHLVANNMGAYTHC